MTTLAKVPSTNTEAIYTGGAAADWLTLTTWNYRQWYGISEMLFEALGITQKRMAAKLQYQGSRVSCESGGMFAGIGQQMGRTHCIIEISGGAAHDALEMLAICPDMDVNEWRCTRIDLQRTLDVGGYTSEDAASLHGRIRQSGLTCGFVSSKDRRHGELATVYIGSQKSGRFMRVYQKVVGDAVMLRAEIVFRHAGGSDMIFRQSLRENGYSIAQGYMGAIDASGDAFLVETFGGAGGKLPVREKVKSKTVSWIIKVVLPVLRRVISQHDAQSHLVAMELMSMIRQCSPPDWWEGDVRE